MSRNSKKKDPCAAACRIWLESHYAVYLLETHCSWNNKTEKDFLQMHFPHNERDVIVFEGKKFKLVPIEKEKKNED